MYAISLAAASKEIWIANSYFLPDDAAIDLMVAAMKRGVDVRVIIPSDEQSDVPATKAAGRSYFGPFLEGGVKIFEYQPTMFHSKTMVVDGMLSTMGSANFDDRSFHLNESSISSRTTPLRRGDERAFPEGPLPVPALHARDVEATSLRKRVTEWSQTLPVGTIDGRHLCSGKGEA